MPAAAPRIFEFDSVASTNDEVRRLAKSGEVPPFWARADAQTAGRGRRGRAWTSAPGNLYLSGLFHLSCPPAEAAQLAFAAALAVGEFLDGRLDPNRVAFKWPNDVKVDGGKIAGILLEANQSARGLELVVGMGVNLAAAPQVAEQKTISVRDAIGAEPPGPQDAARALAAAFERWRAVWANADGQGGFAPIRSRWLARADSLGERVRAQGPDGVIEGVFEDLDETGAMIVNGPNGLQAIRSGEVFFGTDGKAD